jgi:hypothetical protein
VVNAVRLGTRFGERAEGNWQKLESAYTKSPVALCSVPPHHTVSDAWMFTPRKTRESSTN